MDALFKAAQADRQGAAAVARSLRLLHRDAPQASLVPAIVTQKSFQRLVELGRSLHALLSKVIGAELRLARPRRFLFQDEALSRALGPPPDMDTILGVVRADFSATVVNGAVTRLRLMEFNCGDPSALAWSELVGEILARNPPLENFMQATGAWFPRGWEAMWKSMAPTSLNGATLSPGALVAILSPAHGVVAFDHAAQATLVSRAGFDARLVSPEALVFHEEGDAFFEGRRVDLVLRDTWDDVFLDSPADVREGMAHCVQMQRTPCWNPPHAWLADSKALLERLCELANSDDPLLDASQRELVRRVVLPTWMLTDAVMPQALPCREKLVLKPSQSWGGKGVVLGPRCSKDQWQRALEKALADGEGHWVIQEFEPLPLEPILAPGDIEVRHQPTNFNLWFTAQGGISAFTRSSSSEIVNVHLGGSLCPVLVRP